MASGQKVTVNFLVDKRKKRVVLAEAYSDFVDILFSFLTLPLGTIIRLLNKKSNIGCMDKLYESVENLNVQNFQTEACKTMLLFPQSAAAEQCEDLKVNIDSTEPKPRNIYICRNPECCAKDTCLASSVTNSRCPHCQETMDYVRIWPKKDGYASRLFVKSGNKFIISDDLHITPVVSAEHSQLLIQSIGVENACILDLEQKSMDLGREEILTLLKRLLVSNSPLTDLFFKNVRVARDVSSRFDIKRVIQVKREGNTEVKSNEIPIKLFMNKASKRVSFVEAGEEFVNFLFSFLTLPLGSLVKLQNKMSGLRCVDNLYQSAESFTLDRFKSEECKSILLSPKLGPFYGYAGSMLKMDEIIPRSSFARGCYSCYYKNNMTQCTASKCVHGVGTATFKQLNPKSPEGGTETGGGYAKGKFLVTADLCVSPLSTISSIQTMKSLNLSFGDLVTKRAVLGEIQVLDLLRFAVTSKTLFDDGFTGQKQKRRKNSYLMKESCHLIIMFSCIFIIVSLVVSLQRCKEAL